MRPPPGSKRERELADSFAAAFEGGDVERVVSLLTDDAWVTMPPEPYKYQGREKIAEFLYHASAAARVGREARFMPIRVNGQPGFAHYLREPDESIGSLSGLLALVLEGDGIAMLTRFGSTRLPPGLPVPRTSCLVSCPLVADPFVYNT